MGKPNPFFKWQKREDKNQIGKKGSFNFLPEMLLKLN